MSKSISFHHSLQMSNKIVIEFIANIEASDMRSILGKNIYRISQCKTDRHILNSRIVKENSGYKILPNDELWKIYLAQDVIDIRNSNMSAEGFSHDEIDDLFQYLIIS